MAKKGIGPPIRSTDKFPQDLRKGKVGARYTPPTKRGIGPPTRSSSKFPQDLTGGNIGARYKPE